MLTVKENITNALTWFYKKIKLNYLDVIREKLDEFITGHADVFLMDDEGNVYMDEDDTGYVYSWDSSVFARRDTVSDVFDRDKNYSAGDYCIYNNTLYKFIADKEKGIWDDDAVEAVNVTDELKEKEEEITQNTSLIDSVRNEIYYTAGDSISAATINTAGFITSSGASVRFFVPLAKQLRNISTITVTSCTLTLRQDGSYTHGSSSSATVTPSSISASYRFGGIAVDATMSSTSNAVNNAPIGVAATIGFSFS